MAITFTDKIRKETTGGSFNSASPRSILNRQIVTWDLLTKDDATADGFFEADKVTELEILDAANSFLPEVNKDQFDFTGLDGVLKINPWLICSGKQVARDRSRRQMFHVTVDYSAGNRFSIEESELYLIEPPASTDVYPFLKEIIWAEENRVIYEESVSSGKKKMRLPTGNLYSEPFMRRHPRKVLRQTQYEEFADLDDMHNRIEERLFSVQGTAFQGDGIDPPRWMITEIDYQPVNATLAGGSKADAVIMTYTIERTSRDGGWRDRRALLDYHYLTTADDLTTKRVYRDPHDGTSIILALLNADGTLDNQTNAVPNFLDYDEQPAVSWSFLRQ